VLAQDEGREPPEAGDRADPGTPTEQRRAGDAVGQP
jgi:hypothetical protein